MIHKKGHYTQKCGKVMLSFLFDEERPLIVDWLQQDATVNPEQYYNALLRLKQAIKDMRRANSRMG